MKKSTFALSRSGVRAWGLATLLVAVSFLFSCQNNNKGGGDDELPPISSVWVFNEGQFMADNASISSYDPATKTAVEDIFSVANGGAMLGDIASAAVMHKGQMYVTLSGSGKIYVIDPKTGVLTSKITGLNSPRYIHFLSETKAYVTNVNVPEITIINPATGAITGSIVTASPAEMLVAVGGYIYSNLWSYGKHIIKIDPSKDEVVGSVEVAIQPLALVADKNGALWTMCDGGGWAENPAGYEPFQTLLKIDPAAMSVVKKWQLPDVMAFSYRLVVDRTGDNVYYLHDGVSKMSVEAGELPATALVTMPEGAAGYSLGINPENGEIYVGDALDYTQRGLVYRFSSTGEKLDSFRAGTCPAFFKFF